MFITWNFWWRETILILSFSLFFQNNHNFDQSELFVFLKNWSPELKTFSVSSEVLNDWLPVSFGVYNLQQVQADNFFSSNELLNSRRERNNRWRDRFSTGLNYHPLIMSTYNYIPWSGEEGSKSSSLWIPTLYNVKYKYSHCICMYICICDVVLLIIHMWLSFPSPLDIRKIHSYSAEVPFLLLYPLCSAIIAHSIV